MAGTGIRKTVHAFVCNDGTCTFSRHDISELDDLGLDKTDLVQVVQVTTRLASEYKTATQQHADVVKSLKSYRVAISSIIFIVMVFSAVIFYAAFGTSDLMLCAAVLSSLLLVTVSFTWAYTGSRFREQLADARETGKVRLQNVLESSPHAECLLENTGIRVRLCIPRPQTFRTAACKVFGFDFNDNEPVISPDLEFAAESADPTAQPSALAPVPTDSSSCASSDIDPEDVAEASSPRICKISMPSFTSARSVLLMDAHDDSSPDPGTSPHGSARSLVPLPVRSPGSPLMVHHTGLACSAWYPQPGCSPIVGHRSPLPRPTPIFTMLHPAMYLAERGARAPTASPGTGSDSCATVVINPLAGAHTQGGSELRTVDEDGDPTKPEPRKPSSWLPLWASSVAALA